MKSVFIVLLAVFTFSGYAQNALEIAKKLDATLGKVKDKTVDIEKTDTDNKKKKYLSAYTASDGSRILFIPWKDKKSERKWWVDGDKYCGSHPKRGDYCRDIVDAGDGTYHGLDNGKHLRTFSNFRDGNQL